MTPDRAAATGWLRRAEAPGPVRAGAARAVRHWRGWIVILAPLIAFGFSFSSFGDLALSNSPAGLVVFVPLGALILVWDRLRVGPAERSEGRDLFFDAVTAAIPFAIALILLIVIPTRVSLVYWLYRLDLLALPLFVTGVIILTWGFWALRLIALPLSYLFLVSPLPFIWFQQWLGDPSVGVSVWGASGLLGLTGLPIHVDPADGRTIFSDAAGHEFSALVSQVCSGTNLTLGFLLVGAPVMSRFTGALHRKLAWLLVGALLALAVNFVRVFALALGLYGLDEELVFDVLHPVLGGLLFLVLFVAMLFATKPFGLRLRDWSRPKGDWIWVAATPQLGRRGLGVLLALTLTLAVFDAGLADVAWVRDDRLPVVEFASPQSILPPLNGWTVEPDGRLLWGAYFGQGSRADWFIFRSEAIPEVDAQVVIARSLGQLNVNSLESCDLFHGHDITGSRQVPLGYGVTGTVVRTFYEDGPVVTMYWILPIEIESERFHARIALFLDDELPIPPAFHTAVHANPITRATTALNSRLGNFAEPAADETLDRVEGHLTSLARAIVEAQIGPQLSDDKVAAMAEQAG